MIPDFEKYEISNLGRIRNPKTKRLMKQREDKRTGYYRIGLMIGGSKQKNQLVHRLVGFTFIPNTNNYPTIHHENGNRKDNRVVNLKWASMLEQCQPENKLPRTKHNTCGARSVNRIDKKSGKILQTYESCADAGRWASEQGLTKLYAPQSYVVQVCQGKGKEAYGFGWEYTPDEVIDGEIWELLPSSLIHGTEGCFVSNKGRIKKNKGRIYSGSADNGTIRVSISNCFFTLRRLVAEVFIPNPDNFAWVINKDQDIHNNCVENLKWVPLGYRHQ